MTKCDGEAWRAYYDATASRPPRATLLCALAGFAGTGAAVDLGCGDGRDTVELLRRGWTVLAIDAEAQGIERLRARPEAIEAAAGGRLTTQCRRFEEADWPAVDLVNASFALPLCPPDRFPELWSRIAGSLRPGGCFAGQLYGDRDGWAGRPGITCLDRAAALRLLDGFFLERFEEEESDAVTPRGRPKHWHVFHIVARRGR
jgi:SAM-dependent methyltransferase